MEIKVLLTKKNFTSMNNKQNKFIVIHYVGSVSTAYNNAKYFETTYRGASAHYFVDEKDIYQVVREKDASWHCGATYYKHLSCRNSNSIGIEMCCYKNSKGQIEVSEEVERKTIELTKELMKKYNIPITNVIRHYDVTGKACPKPFVDNSSRWINFLNKLQKQNAGSWKQGDRVVVKMPIAICPDAYQGRDILVDDLNGQQFWIHPSVVTNNEVYALGTVCFVNGDKYIIQVFDRQFWADKKFISNP